MSDRWTPSLEDFVDAASFILGAEPEAIRRLPRLALAESAVHAPFASFGGVEVYPAMFDGNKRVAFLLMARFLDANGVHWDRPDADQDAGVVERVAAGEASHEEVVPGSGTERSAPELSLLQAMLRP